MPDRDARSADPTDARANLRADCGRCAALCCVAPAFAASADFAIDKPAGRPCPKLRADFDCSIHDSLRERGFPGCAVFDCFGAGQQVVQVSFAGQDWRRTPALAEPMFAIFTVMRQLKESLWHLAEALTLLPAGPLRVAVEHAERQIRRLVDADADTLASLDAAAHRQEIGALLERVSQTVRAEVAGRQPDRVGADLIGAKLRGADLHGASLRGAYLLGADLRDADLHKSDLLGADLRGADLRAARLAEALFVTQPQIDAALGNASTTLPRFLARPGHWPAAPTSTHNQRP